MRIAQDRYLEDREGDSGRPKVNAQYEECDWRYRLE